MRVSVVGTGRVGTSVAFALIAKGLVDELCLANRTVSKAEGEAKDLLHASAFIDRIVSVRAGWLEVTNDSDVVVICASAPRPPHINSRLELGLANARLFDALVPEIAERSPNAILLIVTNPVDVLTYRALSCSGFDPRRVLGTGTLIDSARYRSLLSIHAGIHPDDIRAYILGEHGDSQFAADSLGWRGGERLTERADNQRLFQAAARTGYEVMQSKGYTNHAIALAVSLIVESIAHDARRTMPLSVALDGYLGERNVCLSIPVVVGRGGLMRQLHPELSPEEQASFGLSARVVRAAISEIEQQLRQA